MFPMLMLIAKVTFLFLLYFFLLIIILIIFNDLRKSATTQDTSGSLNIIPLQVVSGPPSLVGKKLSFQDDVEIGRAKSATLRIDDPTISNHHALLTLRNNHLYLEDLGSTNGTFYKGKKVFEPTIITPGDQFEVGGAKIIYAN